MPNVSFQAPNEYSTESADIERRRRYAEALQAQSMQPLGGTEMAGGWAIKKSPLEGIAKLVQGYAAGKSLEDASARQKALGERYTADRGAALAGALRAGQGSPASTETIMDEQAAGGEGAPAQINAPAVAGSRQAMIAALTGSKFPDLQQAGMAQMMKEGEPFTLAEGAKRFSGGAPIAENPKPQPGFTLTPGSTRFGPNNQVVAAMPKEDELGRALEAAGIDPKSPEAQALFKARAAKIATHAPPTRVNVNQSVSTEKKYGEKFAGEIAQADSAMRDAAIKAPQLADRANQIKQILSDNNVITGSAADFRLAVTKAAALAGIKGADGLATNTEQLATGLAQNTLDAIKASGLGSGNGFSNADRDFLEKAVGGKVNLEKETIDRLANLAHRAAEQTALRWSTRVKEIPASALEGTGIKATPLTVAPLHGTKRAAGGMPAGLDPKVWAVMTPQEKALFE